MWEFSNMNSGSTFWPPDAGQPQNSIVYPSSGISFCPSFCGAPFPGFRVQGSFLQFHSAILPPLNAPAPNPTINLSELEATETKRFLVFYHSGDQTSLIFNSVAKPFEVFNPTQPVRYTYAFNSHISEDDEMHEDTDEIDALLYSDSKCIYDDEESSTGHSPLDMVVEEISNSFLPVKRRKVDSSEIDALLMDTASSTMAPSPHYMPGDGGNDLSFVGSIGKMEDKTVQIGGSRRNKRERLQATVSNAEENHPRRKGKGHSLRAR